ncbi:unnamed protein product, partial [Mesorhabditis spiculigera]
MAAMPNAPATFKQKLAVASLCIFVASLPDHVALGAPLPANYQYLAASPGLFWLDVPRLLDAPEGRKKWYQRLSLWQHFRDYFPLRMVKTADLPAIGIIFSGLTRTAF